jgi:hypothetical protein
VLLLVRLLVRLLLVVMVVLLCLWLFLLLEPHRRGPIQRLLLHLDHRRWGTMENWSRAGSVENGRLHWGCLCCCRRQARGRVDGGMCRGRS